MGITNNIATIRGKVFQGFSIGLSGMDAGLLCELVFCVFLRFL